MSKTDEIKMRIIIRKNANNRQKLPSFESKESEIIATSSIIRVLQKIRKWRIDDERIEKFWKKRR